VFHDGSAESSAIGRLDESDRSQSCSLITQQLGCIKQRPPESIYGF